MGSGGYFMPSSHPKEAQISEPFPCPECGKVELISVTETCQLADGLTIKRLRHFKCQSCGTRLFDDAAMHRIQEYRAEHHMSAQ
jgi:YgiT-type zinc finger domain-containing protein